MKMIFLYFNNGKLFRDRLRKFENGILVFCLRLSRKRAEKRFIRKNGSWCDM